MTGDDATLTAIAERDPPLVAVPSLGDYLAEAGKSVVVVSSGSPGSAWLSNPRPQDHLYNRALVRPAAAQAAVAQFGQSATGFASGDRPDSNGKHGSAPSTSGQPCVPT